LSKARSSEPIFVVISSIQAHRYLKQGLSICGKQAPPAQTGKHLQNGPPAEKMMRLVPVYAGFVEEVIGLCAPHFDNRPLF
jgi:hypothetical protein